MYGFWGRKIFQTEEASVTIVTVIILVQYHFGSIFFFLKSQIIISSILKFWIYWSFKIWNSHDRVTSEFGIRKCSNSNISLHYTTHHGLSLFIDVLAKRIFLFDHKTHLIFFSRVGSRIMHAAAIRYAAVQIN